MAIAFPLLLRAFQFLFAVVVLGTTGYGMRQVFTDRSCPWPGPVLMMVVACSGAHLQQIFHLPRLARSSQFSDLRGERSPPWLTWQSDGLDTNSCWLNVGGLDVLGRTLPDAGTALDAESGAPFCAPGCRGLDDESLVCRLHRYGDDRGRL